MIWLNPAVIKKECAWMSEIFNLAAAKYRKKYFQTVYNCHMLCIYSGMLRSETILYIGASIHEFPNFVKILTSVAKEYRIIIRHVDNANKRIIIDDGYFNTTGIGVQIKYMSPRTLAMCNPIDMGVSADHHPILDLYDPPEELFSDDISVYNLDKLGKYIHK